MKTVSIHQLFQKSSKRMRFLGIASVLLISVLGFSYYYNVVNPNSARAFSGAGLGTFDDPFQISNCSELQSIGNSANGYNYVLINDIDCSDTINWNGGSGFKPIDGYFSGEINGRNYEIKDLYINRPTTYAVGLFSYIGPGAQLTNIRLTKSEANSDRIDINGARSVGALAAEFGGSKIANVHSELNVQSNGRATDAGGTGSGMSLGGLVGINYSNIATSSSSGNVTVADNDLPDRWVSAGGLVGHVRSQLPDTSNASVKNSFATGNVNIGSPEKTINGNCGGLLGEISVNESASTGSEVSNSYSSGSITCDKTDSTGLGIGGLIGAIIVDENATVAPTVMNNFTTSNITTTAGHGFYGIYWNGTEQNGNSGVANTNLSNNANVFDVTRTGKSTCGNISTISCEAVNIGNSQPDYFTSINDNTGFFNTWDQPRVWNISAPLPSLKSFVMRPDPVLNLTVVRNGNDFEASWEDPVDDEGRFTNIRFYQLYYKDKGNNGAWQQYDADTLILEKSKTISGLAIPGNYSFKVRAISDAPGYDVIGLFSAALDFATGMPATPPQNIAVQPNAKSANVTWDAVESATSYQIQYRQTGSTEWKNGGVYSDTNAKIGVLTPSTSYQIRVTASNIAGIGPWSETEAFTTNVQTTYFVNNCQQLQDVNNNLEGIYIQNANIDCSDVPNFAVIGGAQNVFIGSYDGRGYAISNVTISTDVEANSTNWAGVGVFGLVAGGNLANITIKDSTIVGNYKLSESVDSDGNGLPDAPAVPNVPAVQPIGDLPVSINEAGERIQERTYEAISIGQQLSQTSISFAQQFGFSAAQFPNFAVGGVAGAIIGTGEFSNLKSINTTVQGSIAGGVVGAALPVANLSDILYASADDLDSLLATSDGSLTFSNLQSSGNINGFGAGGLIGLGVSSLGGLVGLDGQLIIKDSTSSALVNATIGGGLVGASISPSTFSVLPALLGTTSYWQDPRGDALFQAANRSSNSIGVVIQNSSTSGTVSTCDAPSEVREGALGGLVGVATGTLIKSSTSTAIVSVCSGSPDRGLAYGGAMGGLGGLLMASKIEASSASGDVKALYNPGDYENNASAYTGAAGGLVGIMLSFGDDQTNGQYVINNSHSSGSMQIYGNSGLLSASGGIAGLFLGSGTINNSFSSKDIVTSTAQQNVGAFTFSGGLTGLSLGIDIPSIVKVSAARPDDQNYQNPKAEDAGGAFINNSYASGDVVTIKNGQSGMLAVTGGLSGLFIGTGTISNSHATGAVSSTIPNGFTLGDVPEFVSNPDNPQELEAAQQFFLAGVFGSNYGTAISGGLVGSAYGIDTSLAVTMEMAAFGIVPLDRIIGFQGYRVENSYATGAVDANVAGGLMGSAELRVNVEKSYAEGNINAEVAGGLIGQSGLVSSGVVGGLTYYTAILTNGFSVINTDPQQLGKIFNTGLSAVGPVVINNTYSSGNITATPFAVDISKGVGVNAQNDASRVVPVRLPTVAGGIVGLYMDPGGTVSNSYSAGSITVNPLPERSQDLKIADIPSFAGGIFGVHVAIPTPDIEEILTNINQPDVSAPNSARFMATPNRTENVFSVSTLNLTDKTFTGGSSGVFVSPFNYLDIFLLGNNPQQIDTGKFYSISNNYFDKSKVNVEGCSGPNKQASDVARDVLSNSFIPGSNGNNLIPSIPEGEQLTPESVVVEDTVNAQFTQNACQFVNANNQQPNYFKSNKSNAPLNSWNFSDVWVVSKDSYPKFVAGATTNTPNSPTSNGASPTTITRSTPKATSAVKLNPKVSIDASQATVTGVVQKQLKNFGLVSDKREQVKGLKTYLANVPIFIARSIPYTLILLLLMVATLYSWQALRQYRQLSIYHKNIMRILTTKESVDNYLAITTHYLNTPVAIMSGSVELLVSLKKITSARADALSNKIKKFSRASEQLLVANQVSGAQSANDEKILKHDQTNPLLVKEVWIPAVIALSLIVLANALFIYAEVFTASPFRIGIEIGLFLLSVLLVALAYRYREYLESSKLLAKDQLKLESELYKKREAFIPEALKVTSEHLESLQITGKTLKDIPEAKLFFNGLAMLEGINKGLLNLTKFAEFSSNSPLFDITTYARKSVEKYSAKAKAKNVKIESKVDHGLVSHVQPEEIRQLVDSLLENAVKFSNDNTTVSLSIYRRFNKIVISVSDKGVGISEHKLPSLLKPFSRGTDSMQYNYEGVGLGLYADKIIVDKLGGTISITSKLGEGTTTTVAIPSKIDAKESIPVLIMPDVTPA